MALPADTAVETAIVTIEQALLNDVKVAGTRQAISDWRAVLAFIETLGGSGYDALAQEVAVTYASKKLYGAA